MIVVVTGGAGFLGSHLCDRLLDEGHKVLCIDNLLTGSMANIKHLESHPNFDFLELNVEELSNIPPDIIPNAIYHLASPASPNEKNPKSYISFPFETMMANSLGTLNLCEWALRSGAKFLFASTSEIYGDPLEHPQKETYRGNVSTTGPRAVYDEAKRFGETIVSTYVRNQKMDGRIIRIFNTYGPRMADDGRVVIEFIKAGLSNQPFPVFGDGSQTRSFCYVSDLIEGMVAAMDKGSQGEVYNLGNPNEFTILELAEKVKQLTGSTSQIQSHPLPMDDPKKRCPDITKAKEQLGWEPKVPLDEGLKKLIESLRSY